MLRNQAYMSYQFSENINESSSSDFFPKKLFNTRVPIYLGIIDWLDEENIKFKDIFGGRCYIFAIPFWTFLQCAYDLFHDHVGETIRNIDRNGELLIIGEKGTFIFSRYSFMDKCFRRCMQPNSCLYKLTTSLKDNNQNADDGLWEFELISCDIYRLQKYFSFINNFKNYENFESLTPYPNSLIENSSFLSEYLGKPFMGPNNPISPYQQELFKKLTGKNLKSSRELLTFFFRVMRSNYEDNNKYAIVKVRAFWLNFENNNTSISSESELDFQNALFIQDFPGFDLEHINERIPTIWFLSPTLTGYCCGHGRDFFVEIFSNKFYFGHLICVDDYVAWVDIPTIGCCTVKLPPNDDLTDRIKAAFADNIIVKVCLIYTKCEYRAVGLKPNLPNLK